MGRLRRAGKQTPLNYHVPVLALAATLWMDPGQLFPPLDGLIGVLVYHANLVFFSRAFSFRRTPGDSSRRVLFGFPAWRAARHALTVWLTYNRHRTKAAGVFQLPVMPSFNARQSVYLLVLALNVAAAIPLVRSHVAADKPLVTSHAALSRSV